MPASSSRRLSVTLFSVLRTQASTGRIGRDFPDAALHQYGLEAQSPDEFLLHLLDLEPELMVRIVTQQAADLRNPAKTLDDVLDELALHAPGFAAAIRDSRSTVAQ
jgi:hypothetical protein